MAKGGRNQGPSAGSKKPRPPAKGKGRSSVASARRSGGDRMQFIIGGVAIIVIVAIIVVGLVIHSHKTAVQAGDYGSSVSSTATVNDKGIITVSHGDPKLTLDVYEDAICPYCAQLEHQYGQQMAQAVDAGVLTIRYHMVDFLDSHSASGTYSKRAYAAMISVAKHDGEKPGVLMNFHSALFNADNQPKESGSSDLSNKDLAKLAGAMGASKTTQDKIADGAEVKAAGKDAEANFKSLTAVQQKVGRGAGTPTVAKDGVPVNTGSTDWLTKLLPDDYTPSAKPSGAAGSK